MRIRSTKPEFWRSSRIASVSWDARLVLKGLESYVDDNGVGKDDLALIVADVFPRDLSRSPTGTLQKVAEAITDLSDAGLLWRYEVDGTPLLFVSWWETFQRIEKPSAGRLPRPDGTMAYRESVIGGFFPEGSGRTPVALRPGTGEQGNRGTGENPVSSAAADAATDPARPDVEKILDHLDDRIRANGAKVPTRTKRNTDAARLLLDVDGHTVDQILKAIDFATRDEFWRTNVLSMSTLRKQYDKLRLAAQRTGRPSGRTNGTPTNLDGAEWMLR